MQDLSKQVHTRLRPRHVHERILERSKHVVVAPSAQRALAGRCGRNGVDPLWLLDQRLRNLDLPDGLPDLDRAAGRIVAAVAAGEIIGVETDYDVDGQSAHAVLRRGLVEGLGVPGDQVRSYIGHRLVDGYGLSEGVCQRILHDDPRPSVLITADNGSSDEPRIRELQQAGVDVIVTDHHDMPAEGVPASALACVSPKRSDATYPDSHIAGVAVAWLLIVRTLRRAAETMQTGLDPRALLDYVALGTVADCVSLGASRNNRIFVREGLRRMNQGEPRACWQALRAVTGRYGNWAAEDLAFQIAPRLNARGRLNDAWLGVELLLNDDPASAETQARTIDSENSERKAIQEQLLEQAQQQAIEQLQQGRRALTLVLNPGHPGVHGIVAGRIAEQTGHPVACFSVVADAPEQLTGSLRSGNQLHVRQALQRVDEMKPGCMTHFGGHEGAGGCTLAAGQAGAFAQAFEQAVVEQLGHDPIHRIVETDGTCEHGSIGETLLRDLEVLEPFGIGFPRPAFEATVGIRAMRPLGDGSHWRLTVVFEATGELMTALWFGIGIDPPADHGDVLRVVFTPVMNEWNGERSVQLHLREVRVIERRRDRLAPRMEGAPIQQDTLAI